MNTPEAPETFYAAGNDGIGHTLRRYDENHDIWHMWCLTVIPLRDNQITRTPPSIPCHDCVAALRETAQVRAEIARARQLLDKGQRR